MWLLYSPHSPCSVITRTWFSYILCVIKQEQRGNAVFTRRPIVMARSCFLYSSIPRLWPRDITLNICVLVYKRLPIRFKVKHKLCKVNCPTLALTVSECTLKYKSIPHQFPSHSRDRLSNNRLNYYLRSHKLSKIT